MGYIIDLVKSAVMGFIGSLGWWQIAAGLAVALTAVVFISAVLGAMKKHVGTMMVISGLLMVVAWYGMPKEPTPKTVITKRDPRITFPGFKMPVVNLPKMPEIKLPKLPEITLPKLPGMEELARLAEAQRLKQLEEERQRRLAEAMARKRARAAALRDQNERAMAEIDAWIASGIRQAEWENARRQQQFEEQRWRMLNGGR
jgi:hypothetical protein